MGMEVETGMEVKTGMEVMETGMELRLWMEVGVEVGMEVESEGIQLQAKGHHQTWRATPGRQERGMEWIHPSIFRR